jgi:hypothetical protein
VFGVGVSFFRVVSCSDSLWCSKWWRRFGDLFDFLAYLPQRIIGGVCWSEALQVAFQPAHWIVLLKNLTAASIFASVLREIFS